MSQRYLYEVHPQKAILIPGQRPQRRPFSNLLTKDEVLEYMKSGRIYRKFSATEMVLVTGENINRLHRDSQNAEAAMKAKEVKRSPFSNLNKESSRGTVSVGASSVSKDTKKETDEQPVTEEQEPETVEEDQVESSYQNKNRENNRKHNGGSRKNNK